MELSLLIFTATVFWSCGWLARHQADRFLDWWDESKKRERLGAPSEEEEPFDTWLNRVEDEHVLSAFHEAGLYIGSEPWPGDEEPAENPVAATAEPKHSIMEREFFQRQQLQLAQQLQGSPGAFTGLGALQAQQRLGGLVQQLRGAPGFNPFHGMFG